MFHSSRNACFLAKKRIRKLYWALYFAGLDYFVDKVFHSRKINFRILRRFWDSEILIFERKINSRKPRISRPSKNKKFGHKDPHLLSFIKIQDIVPPSLGNPIP